MSDEPETLTVARRRVTSLKATLAVLVERDPRHEVGDIAIPVLDAVLREVRDQLGNDPVVAAMMDVISPEVIEAGEPILAGDVLLVVDQLAAVLGPEPIVMPRHMPPRLRG